MQNDPGVVICAETIVTRRVTVKADENVVLESRLKHKLQAYMFEQGHKSHTNQKDLTSIVAGIKNDQPGSLW